MRKELLNAKLQTAESVIAQLMAQNATLKAAYETHTDKIARLRDALRAHNSPRIVRRVWSALNKRGQADM